MVPLAADVYSAVVFGGAARSLTGEAALFFTLDPLN